MYPLVLNATIGLYYTLIFHLVAPCSNSIVDFGSVDMVIIHVIAL